MTSRFTFTLQPATLQPATPQLATPQPADLVDANGKYRTQAVLRLPLRRAHLVWMHLLPGRGLLDRLVASWRLKRNPGLEIHRELASFRHGCIPPKGVGMHVTPLSDFLGPPPFQSVLLRKHSIGRHSVFLPHHRISTLFQSILL